MGQDDCRGGSCRREVQICLQPNRAGIGDGGGTAGDGEGLRLVAATASPDGEIKAAAALERCCDTQARDATHARASSPGRVPRDSIPGQRHERTFHARRGP